MSDDPFADLAKMSARVRRVCRADSDTLAKATVDSETYAALTAYWDKRQTHRLVRTRATRNGTLPLMPEFQAADTECDRLEKLLHERTDKQQLCNAELGRARQAATDARTAAEVYVKARPFIGVVRKQQSKAETLRKAAEHAAAHVASCETALCEAENACRGATKALEDARSKLWKLQAPVAKIQAAESSNMSSRLQDALKSAQASYSWMSYAKCRLLNEGYERDSRLRNEIRLQTDAVLLLEMKLRAYTSQPGRSDRWHQWTAEYTCELEAARKKLGDAQVELDSPEESAMRKELKQTCHAADLAVQFWKVASECFNKSES